MGPYRSDHFVKYGMKWQPESENDITYHKNTQIRSHTSKKKFFDVPAWECWQGRFVYFLFLRAAGQVPAMQRGIPAFYKR